jgi:hypothetical protein
MIVGEHFELGEFQMQIVFFIENVWYGVVEESQA